ncbi:tyrosine-type recombinase/integrase [Chryseobacterium sp. HR92]|uniref:tyrosine-type recombinase/integrase n=1 Tax=Chryseobacterium sp. HR92 TaxID=3094839 RepID=UPI0038910AB7|nr:site-specific integrase [Chryseobacterium sp. HR92]
MKPHHSPIKVYPTSWDKRNQSNLKKDWEIRYSYFSDEFPNGKIIRFKGMNHCKTLNEKQDCTKMLIEKELFALSKGFNPVIREYEVIDDSLISPSTPFIKALEISLKSFKGVDSTLSDYDNSVKHIKKYASKLGINHKDLNTVSKGDIKQLLMKMSEDGYSNYRVNKTRSHLSRFFSHFVELDIFLVNFIEGIKKLEHESSVRNIIRTSEDWKKFHSISKINHHEYAFAYIFLFSGSRFTEMAGVRKCDVELEKSIFWINLKKGGKHKRVMRPINMEVWRYWKEYYEIAATDEYLFSEHRIPGAHPVKARALNEAITKHLKLVGLKMKGYDLKATFLNLVSKEHGITKAKELAGHTTERTTRIYAIDYEEHMVEQNRKLKINTQ